MNMTIHSNAEEYNIRMFVRPVQSRNQLCTLWNRVKALDL